MPQKNQKYSEFINLLNIFVFALFVIKLKRYFYQNNKNSYYCLSFGTFSNNNEELSYLRWNPGIMGLL